MKIWQEVFSPPFSQMKGISWVLDSKDTFVFQFITTDEDYQAVCLEIINGSSTKKIQTPLEYKGGYIQDLEGRKLLLIRSWGHLTGVGGLNLPAEEARAIQDSFAEWLLERLNGNGNV